MADERKRLHDRKLIRLADHNASGLQLLHRRVVLLYIRARAADRRNKVKCPAFRLGPLLQGMDRRKQRAGHIRMRTVAQHDIEEDHARRGIFNGLLHAFDPLGGIDHRMRTADRVDIVAQIHDDMPVAVKHKSLFFCEPVREAQRVLHQRRGLARERPAGIVGLDATVLFRREGAALRLRAAVRHCLSARKADGKPRRLVQRIGVIEILLVVGRLLP